MTTQPTPGPWRVEPTPGPWTARKKDRGWTIFNTDEHEIAWVTWPWPPRPQQSDEAEYESNARLIAAAPRMLELVRTIAMFGDVENADERAMLAERYAADAIKLVRDLHGEGQ